MNSSRIELKFAVALWLVVVIFLLSSALNAEQALASHLSPVDNLGYSDPKSPGQLTVTGTWKYYDRYSNLVPAKQFHVRLFNGTTGAYLAQGNTDVNGEFTLGPVTNPGDEGIRVRIYTYVKYWPHNYEIVVVYPDGDDWTDTYTYETQKLTHSDGTYEIPDDKLIIPLDQDTLDA